MASSTKHPTPDVIPGFAVLLAAHTRGPALLTRSGLRVVQRALTVPVTGTSGTRPNPRRPVWDRTRRQLSFGGDAVWTFTRRAPRQMVVLDALERGRWATAGVPNPFLRTLEPKAARRRLHETVANMNRNLKPFGLALREDGERVWWQRVQAKA